MGRSRRGDGGREVPVTELFHRVGHGYGDTEKIRRKGVYRDRYVRPYVSGAGEVVVEDRVEGTFGR